MKPIGKPASDSEVAIETALQSITEWQGLEVRYEAGPPAVVSPIHRAVESLCYKVQAGREVYFVKLRQPDMRTFFDDRAVAANCRIASDAAVSPKLFAADPEIGLLIYEHLSDDWNWCKVDTLADKDLLAAVVHAKKRLHEGPAFFGEFDVFATIEGYLERILHEEITVPADVPAIAAIVGDFGQAIAAAGIQHKSCHGDGVASNIMIGPDRSLHLVDYDRSGNADPFFDLGSLMLEAFQFENDERVVLEIYEGHCRDAAYHRCKLYGIADDLMWALWGFISFQHSPRKEVEFTKYAEWRLLRARWNLGNSNFPRWLSNLG